MPNKKRMLEVLRRYAGSEVVQSFLSSRGALPETGVRKTSGTVLCSDISRMSGFWDLDSYERQSAKLNKALALIFEIIKKQEGSIESFSGDLVVSYWRGESIELTAEKACSAALDLADASTEIGKILEFDVTRLRIGVASGDFYIGNLGSTELLNYTIIGPTINLAARIQGMCKMYPASILMCGDTSSIIQSSYATRELSCVRVMGVNKPVTISELICKQGDLTEFLSKKVSLYCKAYNLFSERKYQDALVLFEELVSVYKDEPSMMFAHRCKTYSDNPPPGNWDGVYKIET